MDLSGHHDRTFEDDRYEQPHRLTEHMAEREQVDDADRLKGYRPFSVFRYFRQKGSKVRTDIAMTMNHPFGIACRAGSVDDFHDVVRPEVAFWKLGLGRQCRKTIKISCR